MTVVNKPAAELKPYGKNAKKHDKKQIANVAESIKQFGFVQPIVLDKDNNVIIGHCRLEAAKKLHLDEVPCVMDNDLTDEQVKKLRLLDNKLNESDWDIDLIAEEIADLDFDGFDVDWELPEDEETEIIEDEAPEVDEEAEPITKLGDIWQLGRHRLMCADSTDKQCVETLMGGQKADLLFTDPPYGYEYQSNMRTKSKKFDVIENDDKILDFIPALKDELQGFAFICTSWEVLDKWLPLFQKHFDLSNMIIWDKGGGGIGDLKHTFSTDYEIILCSNNGNEITGKRIGSVWEVNKDNAFDYVHATQKPVGLSSIAIENTTKKNANVLDVFCGSGSTLIACEQLDRNCYAMELDPHYCDVIIKRWEDFAGEKAVLVND